MFPILVLVYTRLARAEEDDVAARFGDEWRRYAAEFRRSSPAAAEGQTALRQLPQHGRLTVHPAGETPSAGRRLAGRRRLIASAYFNPARHKEQVR
jgi:hypothetical protein